ncbi:MAG: hypothetical protein DMF12_06660 [Verrucomicrobia bacterium]|nr:MAG: hypothetical protein DMF12_06660 [Verrucomicrobiota bacterium]PYI63324.1 MAG: hypothetical protein DMF07_10620 [Verrucomicrobiota bacterium]
MACAHRQTEALVRQRAVREMTITYYLFAPVDFSVAIPWAAINFPISSAIELSISGYDHN